MKSPTFPRESYIPKNAVERRDAESSAVVYTYEGSRYPCGAVAFGGKRNKPDWHYSFRSVDQMEQSIAAHYESVQHSESRKKERQAKRKAFTHALSTGDILRCSWGYDQTNVDFYEVTRVISGKSVEIREIGQIARGEGWLCGKTKPAPGAYKGGPMVKRVGEGNSVRMTSYSWAYPCNPNEETYWSAYA